MIPGHLIYYFHSELSIHINFLPIFVPFSLISACMIPVDFHRGMPTSGNFPLFCCLFAGLFKPTAYVQFDLDQFQWNAALHVAGVPTGRVHVISAVVRTLQCFKACALIHWQRARTATLHQCSVQCIVPASYSRAALGSSVFPPDLRQRRSPLL